MIYCCGSYKTPIKTVFLVSNFKYRDRKLEVYFCSNCSKLKVVFSQFNVQTGEYEVYSPKSKKRTIDFLRQIKKGKFERDIVTQGSKQKAGFVYGVNKECKNGEIRQYAVDFNDQKKLVKVIRKG